MPLLARALPRVRTFFSLVGRAAWRGLVGFYSSENLTFAACIAYHGLLSLFPFLLLVLSLLGAVTASEEDRAKVLEFALRYFPRRFEFITAQLDAVRQSSFQLGVLGSLLMAWAALGVFGAITSAVNYAFRVERPHGFVKHKVVSFLMLTAAGLLLAVGLALVSMQGVVGASWFAGVIEQSPALARIGSVFSRAATTLLFIFVVGLVFYFVPNAKVRFRDVWVGAVLTGVLWWVALDIFSLYVRDLTRFTKIHGSIGAAVAFLIWIYVSAVIFLYGVEFTAAFARLIRHRPEGAPAAPPLESTNG